MTDIEITDPRVEQYAVEHTTPEPPWFAALAEETRAGTRAPTMMVGTLEGRFLAAVVAMVRPRLVLEIGTFTGYSSLSMAEALPADGRIITCDISEEHVAIARRHIGASPFADRIEIRVGPAIDTIATLPGPFDLVFIDADKPGYLAYYEATLAKLAPEGVIVADNVLWSGRLLDPAEDDDSTRAIREFNDHVLADERVDVVMLPLRDGVSLIRHRRAAPAP
jgi:predicted O-methyltransferase YrrM